MSRLALAVEELHRSEHDLAGALDGLCERHRDDHGLYHVGRDLAAWSREHVRALAAAGDGHGLRLDPAPADDASVLGRAERDDPAPIGLAKDPGLAVLRDLRRLHRMAAGVSLDWEILAQTAQALKHARLLELAERCHPRTLRQLRWANAALKENAAQIMTGR